jgi:hypothetical protein
MQQHSVADTQLAGAFRITMRDVKLYPSISDIVWRSDTLHTVCERKREFSKQEL